MRRTVDEGISVEVILILILILFLRAVFKFARRVHFALRRKMLKPPIARLPAIYQGFINRRSGESNCI